MFAVDTNVLLNLYRYSRSTRDELLRVLSALEEKLFLPHQVGQEFLERRLGTIRKQREGFASLRERVTGVREEIEAELRSVLRLRPGEDLPRGLMDALEEVPSGGYTGLSERLKELEEGLPRASNAAEDDEAWAAVERLFDGKVGPSFGDEQLSEAKEEAERRAEAKVPPGFKDRRHGDYVLWRQTIDEAKRSRRPVVLVTDDRKEDWWWIEHGGTLGPRRELVAEMRKEAGVLLHMYTPDRLMKEARERLGVDVSDESISEAEGLVRESEDDATREAQDPWHVIEDVFGTVHSLTDDEKRALGTYLVRRDLDDVAQALGSAGQGLALSVLIHAWDKLQSELETRSTDQGNQSTHDVASARRPLRYSGRQTSHTEAPIDTVRVTVRGEEVRIVAFTKTLLRDSSEIETVDRQPAHDTLGDATLVVKFWHSVSVNHAVRTIEETALATGVVISTLSHRYLKP